MYRSIRSGDKQRGPEQGDKPAADDNREDPERGSRDRGFRPLGDAGDTEGQGQGKGYQPDGDNSKQFPCQRECRTRAIAGKSSRMRGANADFALVVFMVPSSLLFRGFW